MQTNVSRSANALIAPFAYESGVEHHTHLEAALSSFCSEEFIGSVFCEQPGLQDATESLNQHILLVGRLTINTSRDNASARDAFFLLGLAAMGTGLCP